MNLKDSAKAIVEKVGGPENIVSVTHCVTRLRFVLADESIPNENEIKGIDKVLGVMKAGGQYQVIVGNVVKDVYAEVDSILKGNANEDHIKEKIDKVKTKNKASLINRLSRSLMKMIFPLVPTMAAVGIIKGCLAIFLMAGVLQTTDGTFIILQNINDAFLYFLPIIVAFSVAKTFDSNPYVAAAIGASLVFPGLVKLYNDGTALTFLKIPVILTSYGNSIFPVMFSTFIAAKLEKYLERFIPPFLEFLKIMILLLVMVPFTFMVVGPIFVKVSELLANGTMGVYNLFPLATGVIFGAFWQLCVLFGLHYAFIPILTDITLRNGSNALSPILGMGVWALAGAALGFALKTKRKENKATGYSAMTSALFGITEPAIFGIALPYRKPFICAMIAGGIAGPLNTILGTNQFSPAAVGGILTFGAQMDPSGDPGPLIGFFICFFVSFTLSAVLTYFTTRAND
ncbi:PTS transporter subunit EIIC [Paenibacillus polymyxa]|uniref:PTS transporter subunit EIIC n=1 Tax=Paenibacillus polymyxa TaxID=1406 RepID=UPI002ED38718|nr:PTS transporter subunit EIIC [Paenibacillus polymyxa]